ncbi:MAG: glycosyltransferase family 39 protein [Polyangiaceae bacterium]
MDNRNDPIATRLLKGIESNALWWVLGVGILARLFAFVGLNPPGPTSEGVHGFQASIAQQILDNGRLYYTLTDYDGFGAPLNRPPLYGTLLAGAVKLCGSHYWGSALIQMALATSSLALTYALTRMVFDERRIALVSGLIAALYPYLVINTVATTDRLLQGFLLLAIVYLAIRCDRKQTYGFAVALGLTCGLEMLTRALMVLVLPMMLVWFCWPKEHRRKRIGLSGLVIATAICIAAPWSIYSSHVTGRVQLSHSRPGYMLWAANNPEFEQCAYPVITIDRCAADALSRLPSSTRSQIASLSDAGRDQLYKSLAVNYILSNPMATVSRGLGKLDAAFSPIYNPRINFDRVADTSAIKQLLYTIPYSLVVVLAAIGCAATFRTHGRFLLLVALLFLAVAAFSGLFWAHSVEKLNVQVYLGIFAAPGILKLARIWRSRHESKTVPAAEAHVEQY